MKRILLTVALVLAVASPVQAQTIESVSVPFAVLITEGYFIEYPDGCKTYSDGFMFLEAHPSPYDVVEDDWTNPGRIVSTDQSPVPGVGGCLFELSLTLKPGHDYEFKLFDNNRDWSISGGSMSFGDVILYAPDTIVFVLDQAAFDTGIVSAVGSEQSERPDYPATIEAQEAEIESLKATIEAIETPEP